MSTTVFETTQRTDQQLSGQTVPKLRLFFVLFTLGLLGVLSLLQLPFALPAGVETPFSPLVLRLLGLVQSAVLVAIAVVVGLFTAHKVGLYAPALQALATKDGTDAAVWPVLQSQLLPGAIGAVLGLLVLGIYGLLQPLLMPELLAAAEGTTMPLLMRVLYGGITEELLLRWGMMSFLVWLLWRVGQRGRGAPNPALLWLGNILSALLFGVAHVPALTLYGVALTIPMVLAVVLGNGVVGIVYGWLYWRKGLEAAIIAHMGTHVLAVLVLTPLLSQFMAE